MKHFAFLFAAAIAGSIAAHAQAPAGAPAGANGICKDGTYSMSASKSGACRGHQGVQTWYAAAPAKPATPVAPPPAPTVAKAPAVPAPTPAPAKPAAVAAPTPTPAPTGKKLSPAEAAAAKTAAPGGGPGLVWVNTASNVYHCNGDAFYGKTKAGAYMTESDAKAKGAHGDHGKTCTGK